MGKDPSESGGDLIDMNPYLHDLRDAFLILQPSEISEITIRMYYCRGTTI